MDTYKKAILDIESNTIKEVNKMSPLEKSTLTLINYYYLQSNLRYFCLDHGVDYKQFYKDVLYFRDISNLEFFNKKNLELALDNLTVKQDQDIFSTSKIFCSFHLGSYRVPIAYIARNVRKLGIIIDSNSVSHSSEKALRVLDEIAQDTKVTIIDAEKPSSIFEMIRFVRDGGSLMFYIDGNTGVGSLNARHNMIPVQFNNSTFYTRRGIAEISYLTNTPIIPLLTYKLSSDSIENVIEFYPEITPDTDKKIREQTTHNMTQDIYDVLSQKIISYTNQWEGWLYFQYYIEANKNIILEPIDISKLKTSDLIFNTKQYGTILQNDTYYLYDIYNRVMFKINKPIWDLIYTSTFDQISISTNIEFQKLLQKKIFISDDISY